MMTQQIAKQVVILSLSLLFLSSCARNKGDAGSGGGGPTGGTLSGEAASVVASTAFSHAIALSENADVDVPEGQAFDGPVSMEACTKYDPTLKAACSNNQISIGFNKCTRGSSKATWDGGMVLKFSGNDVACGDAVPLNKDNATLAVAFISTVVNTPEVSVSIDSSTPSGYFQKVSDGVTIRTVVAGPPNMRQITYNGLHIMANRGGSVVWDHTISSGPDVITVSNVGSERRVTMGSIKIQHNLERFITQTDVISTLTFETKGPKGKVCCHPTGGAVRTKFEGGRLMNKTEEMTFGPECGQATVTDADGKKFSFVLTTCI